MRTLYTEILSSNSNYYFCSFNSTANGNRRTRKQSEVIRQSNLTRSEPTVSRGLSTLFRWQSGRIEQGLDRVAPEESGVRGKRLSKKQHAFDYEKNKFLRPSFTSILHQLSCQKELRFARTSFWRLDQKNHTTNDPRTDTMQHCAQ